MDGTDYRPRMDEIDEALADLFARRMALAAEIGAYKKEKGLPVYDPKRELEKLRAVADASPPEIREYAARLFALLMELSRSCQARLMSEGAEAAGKNIVLIGMPGCGKSTLAALLGAVTGREVLDTDALLAQRTGIPVPELLRKEGEEGFRRRETALLRELSGLSGRIVATGGGCVTREENYPLLRRRGLILWVRRDREKLAREGRPLSLAGDLAGLEEERSPLYRRFADAEIDNNASPASALSQILALLGRAEEPAAEAPR